MTQGKVLLFVDRMRVGGIQTLLVELIDQFLAAGQPCELLLLDDGEHYDLEDEVRARIPVHKLEGVWVRKPQDFVRYSHAVQRFFAEHHDYSAVHLNSGPKNYSILRFAKRYGIPVRIAHAHNTGFQTSSSAERLLGTCLKAPLRHYANTYLACSDRAGDWLFGRRRMKNGSVTVLPNGIPLREFAFGQEARCQVRTEWQVGDTTLVVGHVGRFTAQKNHGFLLDIFAELHREQPDSILVLAGIGELQQAARQKAEELGLAEAVRFLDFRSDVACLLQGMDVFVMPSLYEGFPVTAVEAQATGLPCVFSDTITREAKILNAVEYLPLDAPLQQWTDAILRLVGTTQRDACYQELARKGYDVKTMAERLLHIYRAA
ncbi:hypothetical protein B5F79_06500 [Olsenella sp. An285]|uniref:glycosyltransferase family 1 protein n=1 Tax=Olsenella sp. An285 TaxID=1965621 RepID=UPI000B3A1560|nr:glycosyltransferase family 1 protein [Olsenella sp. An285]OUO46568.1 hypothetical protein B5F79_06500 [Olsenella sp. An285]